MGADLSMSAFRFTDFVAGGEKLGATRKWLDLSAESVNGASLRRPTTRCVETGLNRLNAVSHMWIAGKSMKGDSRCGLVNFVRFMAIRRCSGRR
jgi:hypothetical protein